MLCGTSEEARRCVHSLVSNRRWSGDEMLHRRTARVPAIVGAYSKFMNGVDKRDQLKATAPTRRKENSLQMSMFTWLLDMCVHNSYALYLHLQERVPSMKRMNVCAFKRQLVMQLVGDALIERSFQISERV
eukprot:IDg21882t1